MKLKYFIILLLLPLITSGCFLNKNEEASQQPENTVAYQVYRSDNFNNFNFTARHVGDWRLEESSSGNMEGFDDQVSFIGAAETITVEIFYKKSLDEVLGLYNVESQTQTEIYSNLAVKFFGAQENGQRVEAAVTSTGDFTILLTSNNPGSAEFARFIMDFSFSKLDDPARSENVSLSLYFDDGGSEDYNCEATAKKTATIKRPGEDLSLIPEAMKLLIQLSVPEDLEKEGLLTAIPINTRIISFGYEDNKAIVNFNQELNQGGGSCLMGMRRSQIEKTLMALNEVTGLEIKEVEIQVEGDSQSALQP